MHGFEFYDGAKAMLRKIVGNRLVLILVVIAIGVIAWRFFGGFRWTEDVLLPDGRVVTLKRYQEFHGPYEIGSTPSESNYWLEFNHPDTGEIVRWSYSRDLGTVALMIDNGTPYLLVKPAFGSSNFDFNCPDPPYLLFRYSNKGWQGIELAQIPVKKIRSNMTYSPGQERREIESHNNHLSTEQTQRSYILNNKPWFMDFTHLKQQSFGLTNCYRKSDYLLTSPSSGQSKSNEHN